jgi:hypothetical protein
LVSYELAQWKGTCILRAVTVNRPSHIYGILSDLPVFVAAIIVPDCLKNRQGETDVVIWRFIVLIFSSMTWRHELVIGISYSE